MAQVKISLKKAVFALIVAAAVFCGLFYYRNFVDTPSFSVATIWSVASTDTKNTRALPFYYTVGAFGFDIQTMMPRLEYRKGSPRQFVHSISWSEQTGEASQFVHSISWSDLKDTRLEVRGPRTLFKNQTADTLRICMTHMLFATEDPSACIRFRTQFLANEMRELKTNNETKQLTLRWFEIENPSLSDGETPRGIFLSATGAKTREDRYLIVLPKGTIQSWSLRASLDHGSFKNFETLIRTMKISENLKNNQLWVDRELKSIDLNRLEKLQKPIEKIAALAQAQTLLLSKISISPESIEAFLHLGGTARLVHAEAQAMGRYDLSAQSRSLIEGALLYARGIDLKSDATFQLEKLALEVRGRSK